MECSHYMLWWWRPGRADLSWYSDVFGAPATARVSLSELFGRDCWRDTAFVQFICVNEDDAEKVRNSEPDVPNVG